MITATSSVASTILTGAFGTPAPSTPSFGSAGVSSTAGAASSPAYILSASLGGARSSQAALLSNILYAQDTEALLNNPHDNGALTGTPSSYVQQIINALAPGAKTSTAAAATATTPSSTATTFDPSGGGDTTTSDTTTGGLPPDGVVA